MNYLINAASSTFGIAGINDNAASTLFITADGYIAAAPGDGVIFSLGGTMTINGTVTAVNTGLYLAGGAGSILVGATGNINGGTRGIDLSGAGNKVVTNNGSINSELYSIYANSTTSGFDIINNNGTLSGTVGLNSSGSTLKNAGTISSTGLSAAVVGGGFSNTVFNSGSLFGDVVLNQGYNFFFNSETGGYSGSTPAAMMRTRYKTLAISAVLLCLAAPTA